MSTSPKGSITHIIAPMNEKGHTVTSSQASNAIDMSAVPHHNQAYPGHNHSSDGTVGPHTQSSGPVDAIDRDRPASSPAVDPPQSLVRDCIGEFLGTCVLVLFGDGALAQLKLSNGSAGDWASVSGSWGAAIALGVLVAGKSGGHINPAVTLAMAIFRRFPLRKLPWYFLSQFFGALVAAAILWGNYQTSIRLFEGGSGLTVPPAANATAGIFATYPAPGTTEAGMFFSEILATCLLVFMIFTLTDPKNPFHVGKFVPVGLFFVFWGITASFGYETGFAVNPARDFAPRLLTSMVGYGRQVWTTRNHYFVVPLFAPFFGAIFAGLIYDALLYKGTDSWYANMINKYVVRKCRRKTNTAPV